MPWPTEEDTAMFDTVLVANRGEIAVRVIRTLQRLGIRSVAVYSDADADAPARARWPTSPCASDPHPPTESYLSIDAVLAAAAATGAQAIHPGYGFLSENAAFARACADAGVVFIGPGVHALEAMADKISAKALVAERAACRWCPALGRRTSTTRRSRRPPTSVGYPAAHQAVGRRRRQGDADRALRRRARPRARVAPGASRAAAFGDDTLLLERLIERPRHIEVQVLADRAGTTIHLGERECSLQRRHQKVIEEAPSPLLDGSTTGATRARIGEAACEVARSVSYEGAGTVEFLVADAAPDEFFFIEMNTRLQVEHPVTELVTGVDLVEQQLRIAAGEPLALAQDDIGMSGHAIEARIYAESPARDFVPATGTVLALHEPTGEGFRVDSGLVEGLVVGGALRPDAREGDRVRCRPRRGDQPTRRPARARPSCSGLDTNIDELRSVLADPDVRAGRLDTGLLDRRGTPAAAVADDDDLAVAALVLDAARDAGSGPWARDGWRAGGARRRCRPRHPDPRRRARHPRDGFAVATGPHRYRVTHDGETETCTPCARPDRSPVAAPPCSHPRAGDARPCGPHRRTPRARSSAPKVRSAPNCARPCPAPSWPCPVADGDRVAAGDTIVTVEAMKMESALTAPVAGIARVSVRVGDLVRRDQVVAVIEEDRTRPQRPRSARPTKKKDAV